MAFAPYVQGDDLRRVHWKATAHTGKLAVKEYEYRYSGAVQVILDVQQGAHYGSREFSTLEVAVTLTASIINHLIKSDNQAGLMTTGSKITNLPLESGQRQLHRMLEVLALVKDDGTLPLSQVIASSLEGHLSRRCTYMVITPTVDRGIIGPLLALRGRASQVLLVSLDAASFIKAEQEHHRPQHPLLSLATTPMNLKGLLSGQPQTPNHDEYVALLQGLAAAGIEVYPVSANLPLHQALQGIRMRF